MILSAKWRTGTPLKILLLYMTLLLAGCGYSAGEHRVTATTARSTLESVLKSWQAGKTAESWQQQTPKVVVQDMDWKAGAKLQSFEILGEGEAIDANLHCQVKLKFTQPQNGKKELTVTYLVGTSPVLTVFRAMGP